VETGTDVCLISDGIELAMLKDKLGADYCQKMCPVRCMFNFLLGVWKCGQKWSTFRFYIASHKSLDCVIADI